MDGLDIAAFVVMAILAAMAIAMVVFLGSWPGRVAKRLNHPYREAIAVGGWVTLIAGGVAWPFILIWAYAVPEKNDNNSTNSSATNSTNNSTNNEQEA